MSSVIPTVFLVLGGAGLLTALFFLWQSVRAALGVVEYGAGDTLGRERARLLERKSALLDGLADLRFEHEAGKIDDADFAELDAQMREEAKDVLKALDEELGPYRPRADRMIDMYLADTSLDAVAPVGVSARGEGERSPTASSLDSDPERDSSESSPAIDVAHPSVPPRRRRSRPSMSDSGSRDNHLLCPQCMAPNVPDALICVECAARVAPVPCAACQTVNDADATFCKKCGAALADDSSHSEKRS